MKSRSLLILVCIWIAHPVTSPAETAKVWESPLVIPTYELGAPDPHPVFPELTGKGRRPIYPYPALDLITDHRVEKTYRAVFLENEFLRLTVLPELGGRLYAIFDKSARREVLYTNHVIKYGMVAIRGAWISGGIEWNFPDGHSATTVSAVDYVTRTEADGGVSVIVGDTERIQRMQWSVAIRLRPGRKFVECEVTLNNRREIPGRYWYWANAAAHAADDLRFVFPMREAYPHTFWPVFSFPLEGGVDIGTYREVPNPLSLFARNSKRDFMGIYYEKSDWGIVHVADHREVAGKKTWTWGTDPSGSIWIDKLTEKDGQYVEFQAGRFETQMEHEFIQPHRVERIVHYWCPIDHLGGPFQEANRDATLRLAAEGRKVTIAIATTARMENAELILERGPAVVRKQRVTLSPVQAFSVSTELMPGSREPLRVVLKSREGREIISYRSDAPVDGNPEFKAAGKPEPDPAAAGSAELAWRNGIMADKAGNDPAARIAWNQALKLDPGYAAARVSMGISLYRSGEFDQAGKHLEAALRRNPDDAGARYALALVLRASGRPGAAADHLYALIRSGQGEALARYVLGEMALAAGEFDSAVEHLRQSLLLNPRDIKGRTMLVLALRLAKRLDEAREQIEAVVYEMPLDCFALAERGEILKAAGLEIEAKRSAEELWRLLSREPDSVQELVFDYAAAGRYAEARTILAEAMQRSASAGKPAYPMWHYTLGWISRSGGDSAEAKRGFESGSRGNPALVFPHRVEEIEVLKSALEANPGDGRASFYLGNALAARSRGREALASWIQALKTDAANAVARRNAAQGLWRLQGKMDAAAEAFEKAIELAPSEFRLYVEYAGMLNGWKPPASRIQLLERAPESVRIHPPVSQSLADAYVDAGRYADALQLLAGTKIHSGEGESQGLATYRRASRGLAEKYRSEGKHEAAAAEFLKATQYPLNLGVGRSSGESHAREFVAAARELEAAGQSDAAQALWQRAATDPLKLKTEPVESWSDNYYWKAVALEKCARKAEAQALYARLARLADERQLAASEISPPPEALRFLLAGLGLKALNKGAEAREALRRVLQLDPANELALEAMKNLPAR